MKIRSFISACKAENSSGKRRETMKKGKISKLVLVLALILTVFAVGCETEIKEEDIQETEKDTEKEATIPPIVGGTYTFSGGATLQATENLTVTLNNFMYDGRTIDLYGNLEMKDEKYVTLNFTHSKIPTATEYNRITPIVMFAVFYLNDGEKCLDLLYSEITNLSYAGKINSVTDTAFVYNTGTVVHLSNNSVIISRLLIPSLGTVMDFYGSYERTDKFLEMSLKHCKLPEVENFTMLRNAIRAYGIFNDKNNTLELFPEAIMSRNFTPGKK